ncbi:MAG: hypothetical protein ACOCUI_04645 [bacterium]
MTDNQDLTLTIIFAILSNIAIALAFPQVNEVPFWAKYLVFSIYNIVVGMVIMKDITKKEEENE